MTIHPLFAEFDDIERFESLNRANYYELLYRLSREMAANVNNVRKYEHVHAKYEALLKAMEIANIIPKKIKVVS